MTRTGVRRFCGLGDAALGAYLKAIGGSVAGANEVQGNNQEDPMRRCRLKWMALGLVAAAALAGHPLQARTLFFGIGESFTLQADDFAAPPLFSRASDAVAEYRDPVSGQLATSSLAVAASTETSITLTWRQAVKLYDQKALKGKLISTELANGSASAVEDLKISRLTVDGIDCEATLYLCHPYVFNLVPQENDTYAVSAILCGPQKPKVQIEYTSTKQGVPEVPGYRSCRVSDFVVGEDADGNATHAFTFTPPRLKVGEIPTGQFILRNKIGICARQPDLTGDELAAAFDDAVADAAVREFHEISRDLKALTPDNDDPALIWDATGRVKVIVWTGDYWAGLQPGNIVGNFSPADDLSLGYFMYVAPYGQMVDYMLKHKFPLNQEMNNRLALAQKLGLQPADGTTTRKTRFLILWAPPEALFRPAPDPEVDDFEAQLARSYGQVDIANPWITKHYDWKMANSYTGGADYPFTGFGYTYDWSGNGSAIGASEFVILPGHDIEVIDNVLTMDFFDRLDD